MYALLLKDLRMAGTFLWIIVPAFLLYGAQFLAVGDGYYLSSIVITAFLSVAITAVDWKYEMDRFICSLPVDRRRFVQERYLLAAGVTFAGYLLTTAYALAVARLFPVRDQASELASWAGVGTFVVSVVLIFSVYYPCYFRWGLGRGFTIFALIVLALAGVVRLIPGPLALLLGLTRTSGEAWCKAAMVGLMLIGVVHIVNLSLVLSIRSYRARDL
jgi:hypothetical protein